MQTSRNEDEELRGRFTIWLEKTLLRKRNKYLSRMRAPYLVLSLDVLSETALPFFPEPEIRETDFCFEDEDLCFAYHQLYPQYRKLLIMLYVHQLKPSEISKLGYCKGTHQLYSIKYRILQELRAALSKNESS
jgi:DNA-directed RNA polymerase specialized sigma24 family protein